MIPAFRPPVKAKRDRRGKARLAVAFAIAIIALWIWGGKARRSRPVKAQLRSSKLAPQLRQLTVIFPFPRGTRRYCPQLGHLK